MTEMDKNLSMLVDLIGDLKDQQIEIEERLSAQSTEAERQQREIEKLKREIRDLKARSIANNNGTWAPCTPEETELYGRRTELH